MPSQILLTWSLDNLDGVASIPGAISTFSSNGEKEERVKLLKERDDIQRLEDMDLVQKARVKWNVEGDENRKFFHGILKQKIHHQMV
ncbi:hypothetical protein Tco_0928620 [Tanacetum coccineum]